ncbi:response regulator transcription factor [Thalassomonas viridans]|uniref:Response regulator transcription factor n=1 Tax=Thalassomonas viridans TaxID=137584 RepID=A0AAF0CAB4_9GAMM|nr:LytTR family DNA-binding domain-containing protein [Thalassomonas viridans]WDE06688.1 response regulator transcription factor [Thalassomonas viridans]
MSINAVIIDDERLARNELKRLLKKYPEVNIIAEAENITSGHQIIKEHRPDVVFLDIEMPGGTGLELAEQLGGEFSLVFCTAYDEFAVDAFSLNAADYLVKPVNPKRLEKTLTKLSAPQQEGIRILNDDFKLMVKFNETMRIIRLADIFRFQSIGNHAALYTRFGKGYIESSLNKIEARLSPDVYFRASRGDILRLDAIEEMEQTIGYGLNARLINGDEVEVSRRQASKLKQQMAFPAF